MKENKLILLNNNGVVQIGESYKADSGFKYNSGFRNFGSLKIVEDVAQGTAVTFLCGVKVFDKDGVLIIDKRMNQKFHFERELVRRIVLQELLNMLIEANKGNDNFNLMEAKMKISTHLKQAYFESSYKAINNWALEIGLYDNKTETQ
jgi:hypothetical protein